MVTMLFLIVTVFYDDFPGLEPRNTASHARIATEAFLKVLGWTYADSDSKSLPYCAEFPPLGVSMSLGAFCNGRVDIGNKTERVVDLLESVDAMIARDSSSPGELASLHGKMLFAISQTCGRAAVPAVRCIAQHLKVGGAARNNKPLMKALAYLKESLLSASPRTISYLDETRPVIVLSDAAAEAGSTTFAVFVVDTSTGKRSVAGGHIPQRLVEWWHAMVGEQIIGQGELFPIIAIRAYMGNRWTNRRVLFFIDNDSARDALVKAYSPSLASQNLVYAFYKCEMDHPCYPWFARVPSVSNIADLPARGELQNAARLGKAEVFELGWSEDLLSALVHVQQP